MGNERGVTRIVGRWFQVLRWVGPIALLVPETPLIVALLGFWVVLGEMPLIGVLVILLILGFLVRIIALHLARAALERGAFRRADALLQVAQVLYPWSADVLALQGVLALNHGLPDEAVLRLRRAVRLLPGQPSFQVALSAALLELGCPVEAAEVAREALALDDRCAAAHLHLASAERLIGTSSETIEERLRAGLLVATTPTSEATLRCALADHLMREQRVAEATLALHSAEALLSRCSLTTQVALRFRMGELLATQGQIERAREHFRGVEALDPQGRFAAAAWRAARL